MDTFFSVLLGEWWLENSANQSARCIGWRDDEELKLVSQVAWSSVCVCVCEVQVGMGYVSDGGRNTRGDLRLCGLLHELH